MTVKIVVPTDGSFECRVVQVIRIDRFEDSRSRVFLRTASHGKCWPFIAT